MKEATGELNMTVVALIAIAAIGALFYLVIWPMIQRMIVQQTCNTYGTNWSAVKNSTNGNAGQTGTQAEVNEWWCCPADANGGVPTSPSVENGCIAAE